MTSISTEKQNSTEFEIPRRANLYSGALCRWVEMGISIVLGLIVMPLIIRTLGNEHYGLWGLVASFVGFYGLFDLGLSSAVSRFLGNAIGARDVRRFNRVASTGRCLLCIASLLIVVVVLLIMGPIQSILRIPEEYTGQFHWLVMLSAASMAISILMSIYSGALLASEDFVLVSCIHIGASVARSLGGLTVVLMGKGVVGLAVVSLIVTALVQFTLFLCCRIRLPQLKARFTGFEAKVARALIGFGAASFVVMIATVLRSKLDIMLVTRFWGFGQAGLYAIALTVFRYFLRATLAVAAVIRPRLNKLQGAENQVELQAFFLRASHMNAACASLLSGLLIGLAPLLIRLWLGPGYEESAAVLRIIVGGYFLDIATDPGIGSLYATARHRYFAVQTTIEAVASFALACILGSKFGMKGVALGIVIPIIVIKLTVQPWYVAHNLSIGFRGYWFRAIGMAALAMVVLAGGLVPVEYSFARWGWWTAPLIILAALVVHGTILWWLVLDKKDRIHIISRIKQTAFSKKPLNTVYQWSQKIKLENRFPFLCNSSQAFKEIASSLKPYYEEYVERVSNPVMACSLQTAIFMRVFCDGRKPKRILDLGSGFSSFVLRCYAASQNGIVVYSVDDNPEWLNHTRAYLASHNLSTDQLFLWDRFKHNSDCCFDFIFHDLGHMNLRKDSLDIVLKLGKGGIIVLDDMHFGWYETYVRGCLSHGSWRYFDLQAYTKDEFGRYSVLVSDISG